MADAPAPILLGLGPPLWSSGTGPVLICCLELRWSISRGGRRGSESFLIFLGVIGADALPEVCQPTGIPQPLQKSGLALVFFDTLAARGGWGAGLLEGRGPKE